MNLDFNILVFLTAFIFALPIIGYLFRFNIPISLFFFIAGVFMLSILLVTDGIILNDRIDNIVATESTFNITTSTFRVPDYSYNVITSTSTETIRADGTNAHSRAEFLTASSILIGEEIECIAVPLSRTGGPTGTAEIGILDGLNDLIKEFGTIDVSTIETSFMYYEFCLANERYTLESGNYVGIRYTTGTSNATNFISTLFNNGNPFDGTNTYHASFTTSWITATGSDLAMQLYVYNELPNDVQVAGIGGVYSYEDNVMDISFTGDNYQIKVILIFISIMFMVGGALVEVKSRR